MLKEFKNTTYNTDPLQYPTAAAERLHITPTRYRDRERGDAKLLVRLLMLRRCHVDLAAAKRLRDGGWMGGRGAGDVVQNSIKKTEVFSRP